MSKATSISTFHLDRVDEGTVAEGALFTDGRVVLAWLSGVQSMEFYPTLDDLRAVRELSGRSRIIFDDAGVSR